MFRNQHCPEIALVGTSVATFNKVKKERPKCLRY